MSLVTQSPDSNDNSLVSPGELRNALAFKGRSAALYADAVRQVKSFASERIYPPNHLPSVRYPRPEQSIQRSPTSEFDGEITTAEAVATLVLLGESAGLASAYAISDKVSSQVKEVLKIPEGIWQYDVINAFSDFGSYLALAAGVRERILNGEERPREIKTIGDRVHETWRKEFEGAIKQDKMILGEHTADAVVRYIDLSADRDIRGNKQGAKTEADIQARIAGRKHGARLARDLYLEVFERASQELPFRLEPKEVVAIEPQQLTSGQ